MKVTCILEIQKQFFSVFDLETPEAVQGNLKSILVAVVYFYHKEMENASNYRHRITQSAVYGPLLKMLGMSVCKVFAES